MVLVQLGGDKVRTTVSKGFGFKLNFINKVKLKSCSVQLEKSLSCEVKKNIA